MENPQPGADETRTTTILVVEDDSQVRESLRLGLADEGWEVCEAWDRESLFRQIEHRRIDLVTLDLTLGSEDGLELALEIRKRLNLPILMISGRSEPFDRVRGLECGADDYIVKPFHIREVVLRIRKVLEAYSRPVSAEATVLFDHSEFDLKRQIVRHLDGSPVDLTETERKLLELFVRHPGRVLSRDDISQALFARDWSPLDRTIDGHVARLRRKIEPAGEKPLLIRSVRGVGYVFSGEVQPVPPTL